MTLTWIDLLILVAVAAVCGFIGQAISGYSRGGILVAIALGFIGALLGTWLARVLALPEVISLQVGDTTFPIIWSIIGSALFMAIIGLLTGGWWTRRMGPRRYWW
jgi:uncharacterized membrane protein YeaQ/YmgE (transglycosylase-associated protein family)